MPPDCQYSFNKDKLACNGLRYALEHSNLREVMRSVAEQNERVKKEPWLLRPVLRYATRRHPLR